MKNFSWGDETWFIYDLGNRLIFFPILQGLDFFLKKILPMRIRHFSAYKRYFGCTSFRYWSNLQSFDQKKHFYRVRFDFHSGFCNIFVWVKNWFRSLTFWLPSFFGFSCSRFRVVSQKGPEIIEKTDSNNWTPESWWNRTPTPTIDCRVRMKFNFNSDHRLRIRSWTLTLDSIWLRSYGFIDR